MGEICDFRPKTKVDLKPKLKMKVVWNTCDKELGGEWSLSMKTTSKVNLNGSKSHSLLNKFL